MIHKVYSGKLDEESLDAPRRSTRREILERAVKERTPQYVILGKPECDEKLLQAHYLLAKLNLKEGYQFDAKKHLQAAINEFDNLCRVKADKPKYIMGREGLAQYREQRANIENDISRHMRKLTNLAGKIDSRCLFGIVMVGNAAISGRTLKGSNVEKIVSGFGAEGNK